jgi:hypothetical protein
MALQDATHTEVIYMQCDIQFQGNKKSSTAELNFIISDDATTRVEYNGKTGFLKRETLEVFKDSGLIVLWFKIVKTQGPITG